MQKPMKTVKEDQITIRYSLSIVKNYIDNIALSHRLYR